MSEIEKKKRAGRSPGYPAIDIETALKRAETLYEEVKHYPSHIDNAGKHWGWASNSSSTDITVSALKKYKLLIYEGSGKNKSVRLTNLALGILRDKREDSTERSNKIKEAALNPKICQEMYDKYKLTLPADEDLAYPLENEKGFSSKGAKEFINQYKKTLNYIRSLGSDISPQDNGDSEEEKEELYTAPTPPKGGNMKSLEILIPIRPWPVLTVPFPMSETTWKQMMEMLGHMKSAIVKDETKENSSTNEDDAE